MVVLMLSLSMTCITLYPMTSERIVGIAGDITLHGSRPVALCGRRANFPRAALLPALLAVLPASTLSLSARHMLASITTSRINHIRVALFPLLVDSLLSLLFVIRSMIVDMLRKDMRLQ
jgi:hypothetical protein